MSSTTIGKKIRQVMWATFGCALLLAGLVGTPPGAQAAAVAGFTFEKLATLGDAAPGGGTFVNDFEVNAMNAGGADVFGADVSTGGEGIFLRNHGQISQLARSGDAAPGGGVFDFGFLGPSTLNDVGDAAFAFFLSPFTFPFGVNSGVYRFSHVTKIVTPLLVPFVTPSPTGGLFQGTFFGLSMSDQGALVFPGIVQTANGIHLIDEPDTGLGMGVFEADANNTISSVVVPGDPAPQGGTFDWASQPWTNDGGDVAFVAHVAGEECRAAGFLPQAQFIGCLGSLYVSSGATGQIQSVAHAGDPAPGGGVFRQTVSPVMNSRGDVAFIGDLTSPPDANQVTGVYLYSHGAITRVAGPGDAMPGGGNFVTASTITGNQMHVNNAAQVVFNAVLDTDVDADSVPDTGLYSWSNGVLQLVARTGTVIPGVGTISRLVMGVIVIPPPPGFVPNSGAINNDRGQIIFAATLADGHGVMLLATPH